MGRSLEVLPREFPPEAKSPWSDRKPRASPKAKSRVTFAVWQLPDASQVSGNRLRWGLAAVVQEKTVALPLHCPPRQLRKATLQVSLRAPTAPRSGDPDINPKRLSRQLSGSGGPGITAKRREGLSEARRRRAASHFPRSMALRSFFDSGFFCAFNYYE